MTQTQKSSEFVWIQRDGTPIHVRAMGDSHLLNTIRMLRRHSKDVADRENAKASSGIYDADDAKGVYLLDDDVFAKAHPTWDALQFERRMRGLEELEIITREDRP